MFTSKKLDQHLSREFLFLMQRFSLTMEKKCRRGCTICEHGIFLDLCKKQNVDRKECGPNEEDKGSISANSVKIIIQLKRTAISDHTEKCF